MRSNFMAKVILFVLIPVFLVIVPVAVCSQQAQEKVDAEVAEVTITMQSEMDSLVAARDDSAVVAKDLADMSERKRLGPILYN